MNRHLIYAIHSTTYEITCSCGLVIGFPYGMSPRDWIEYGAHAAWTDHKNNLGKFYIIHASDRNAWGPLDSFELAEQMLLSDKWLESWCYVGDQINLNNFKEIDLYTPSDFSPRFAKYDMSVQTEKEFIL